LAIAVQQIVWGVSQPIAGAISDRFGAARVLAAGAILYGLALVLMSTASGPGMLIFSTGFLTGLSVGAASFAVVLSAVGRMVPAERRLMTLGIVSAIGSLGQFALVPVARAARARPYLLLNGAFFVCGFHVTFIATHLRSDSEDLGQSTAAASTALALIGLFNVFGSLAAGWLGARYSNTKLLAGIYGLRAVVITAFMLVPASSGLTVAFGAAIGVLWLSTVPLTSGMVTEQFGTAHSGTLFGIVFLSHQVGAFAGAWMGGELADATGSYDSAWWIAVGLGAMAMVLHLLISDGPVPDLPSPGRRVRLAPAGGAALLVLLAVATVNSTGEDAEAGPGKVATAPVAFCVLHPI
jgi:MFS family permease